MGHLAQLTFVSALLSACGEASPAPATQDFGAFELKVSANDQICGSADVTRDTLILYLPPDNGHCDAPGFLVQVMADREDRSAVGGPFEPELSPERALLRANHNERYTLTDPGLGGFQPMNFEGALAWSSCRSSCVVVFRYRSALVRVTWSREATTRAPDEIPSWIRAHLVRWSSGNRG